MTEWDFLHSMTHEKWTGLSFSQEVPVRSAQVTRLCEAVNRSYHERLTVVPARLECLGALRSLGVSRDDTLMAQQMAERAEISPECARDILDATPTLQVSVGSVEMGELERPNVFIAYLTPSQAMKLLRVWQAMMGRGFQTELSSFTAICGAMACAVRDGAMHFSFGCPDSREYGGVPPDRLVAVLPFPLVSKLMKETRNHANL